MPHLTFGTLKMWTTLGLVGLVSMLMASEVKNSQNLQTRRSHNTRIQQHPNASKGKYWQIDLHIKYTPANIRVCA